MASLYQRPQTISIRDSSLCVVYTASGLADCHSIRRLTTQTVLAVPKDRTFSVTKTFRLRRSEGASMWTKVPSSSSTTTPTTLQPHYQTASTPSMPLTAQTEPFSIEYFEESVNVATNRTQRIRTSPSPSSRRDPALTMDCGAPYVPAVGLVAKLTFMLFEARRVFAQEPREQVPMLPASESLVLRKLDTRAVPLLVRIVVVDKKGGVLAAQRACFLSISSSHRTPRSHTVLP